MKNETAVDWLEWHTEQRRVADLVEYEYNPRVITEEQQQDLIDSLNKFNLVDIPVLDHDGTIISGKQRVTVLKMIGRGNDIIDVRVPNRKLTLEEFQEYNIKANKHNGSWDYAVLATAFDTDKLQDWGFTPEELNVDIQPVLMDEIALPNTEKKYEQMTFTLTTDQVATVRAALDKAKGMGEFIDTGNENSNGNSIARICELFTTQIQD